MRERSERAGCLLAMALVVVVGAGAGCAAPVATATSPADTPPASAAPGEGARTVLPVDDLDIRVEIRQSRADWADRVVQLRILNESPEPVTVTSADLVTPTAEGTARSPGTWSRTVPPGRHRDASVRLGPPVCGTPPSAAPQVRVGLTDDGGRTGTAAQVPEDPQGHLTRIHGEDCAALAVAAGVRLTLAALTVHEGGGVGAALELNAHPVPGGPVVVLTSLDGTVLVRPDSGSSWSLTPLGVPVTAPATISLPLTPARCDPHAVAEDKRGTAFGVHAEVDGVEQPVFYLVADEALRGQVHDYIGRYCAWSGDGG